MRSVQEGEKGVEEGGEVGGSDKGKKWGRKDGGPSHVGLGLSPPTTGQ
jgi:hypothetical protein